MARKATGQVKEIPNRDGTISYAIRFRAYGKRPQRTLGRSDEGYTRRQAEIELQNVLADVRRGIWRPEEPVPVPEAPSEAPTFHEFSTEWLTLREPEVSEKTVAGYRWALELHLLPVFASFRLSEIKIADVDRYKSAKLREGRLGAAQINKTLKTMSQILDLAAEYGLVSEGQNPASGKRRRLREPKPERVWVEPEQLPSLLGAADERLRPLLSLLAGGGLRPSEALALNRGVPNLATASIRVGRAKTDAGSFRTIELPVGTVEDLAEWIALSPDAEPDCPLFVNRNGRRQTLRNLEVRLKTVIARANERLTRLGIEAISPRATPRSLRRTYASLRYALGDDPVYVSEQIGHSDSGELSMRVYARAVKRRERLSGAYLREYETALDWARLGTTAAVSDPLPDSGVDPLLSEPASASHTLALGPDSSAG